MNENWYTVGIIVNTHGIRGELKVVSKTDFPQQRFAPGSVLMMVAEDNNKSMPVTIASSRAQKSMYIVKLKGFDSINEVEQYKGWTLKVSEEQQGELEEGQYYYHEIIGCSVVTEDGEELGTISEILSPGANDVWVVERPKGSGKPILIPVIDQVVRSVDVKGKIVSVSLMEGLI
ncbi:ribosome maturation factor RimM [Paenibacillus chungangensis]|uniref:Ribosome maturation factor RimM n=1 Tax=Paenibacillus chungangensis TaxID=696535 RepID=A0ABW3HPL5_9BACL